MNVKKKKPKKIIKEMQNMTSNMLRKSRVISKIPSVYDESEGMPTNLQSLGMVQAVE